MLLVKAAKPWSEQKPEALPMEVSPGGSFGPWFWSADGKLLLVQELLGNGTSIGIKFYNFNSRRLEKVSEAGEMPCRLGDSRRLLLVDRGNLLLMDSVSKRGHDVLSVPPNEIEWPTLSRDNRTIVFLMVVTQADVWLATLQ